MNQAVGNAADRNQVRQAGRKAEEHRRQLLADWRAILATPGGRRVFAWVLGELQPRAAMWQPSALMQFNAARHDVGTWLRDHIDEADDNALLLMMMEERNREKQKELEGRNAETQKAQDE